MILAVVICAQLLIYALAAGVCSQRALADRPVGQVFLGTLEKLQMGFDATLNLLLALLGGAALTGMDRERLFAREEFAPVLSSGGPTSGGPPLGSFPSLRHNWRRIPLHH